MDMFCPLVAPLAEKINFSPKQKFSEFQRICHIYVSNWALCEGLVSMYSIDEENLFIAVSLSSSYPDCSY